MSLILDPNAPTPAKVEETKQNKRIFIMIEETGVNGGFQVYLGGDIHNIGKTDPKDYSPAEFWANAIFGLAISALQKAGVIKSREKPNEMGQE